MVRMSNNPYAPPGAPVADVEKRIAIGSLNPWFSMWTRPRATISQIIARDPTHHVLLLALSPDSAKHWLGRASRALPYDAEKYKGLPRDGYSLRIGRGSRSVGYLLDKWVRIQFDPAQQLLSAFVYGPVSECERVDNQLTCEAEERGVEVAVGVLQAAQMAYRSGKSTPS
jgi:hypothetical protein